MHKKLFYSLIPIFILALASCTVQNKSQKASRDEEFKNWFGSYPGQTNQKVVDAKLQELGEKYEREFKSMELLKTGELKECIRYFESINKRSPTSSELKSTCVFPAEWDDEVDLAFRNFLNARNSAIVCGKKVYMPY